jgi:L-ascorbate metabolism protein UlaG (beta-lactamase superfamily)
VTNRVTIMVSRVLTALVMVVAVLSQSQGSTQSHSSHIELRYVANAGILVSLEGRRFLIDAPIREGIAPYATSPDDERKLLEEARAPYDSVDAILVTHWHEDHFSPEAVAAHITRNARAVLISSAEVVDRVRAVAPNLDAARLRAVIPPPGESQQVDVGGVPVRVLRIRHNPTRRLPEQHVGFLIGTAQPVLHVGDADPTAANFALLRSLPGVDLALLPFWYVQGETSRHMVAESIKPKRIVGMHLPPSEWPAVSEKMREAGVHVVLPRDPGTAVALKP